MLRLNQLKYRHCGPLDLQVNAGQCIGLYGESGSGKSLLLRAIADLDEHHGEVLLDDISATQITAPEWRHKVGLLAADSQWWFDSVGEHFTELSADAVKQLGFPEQVQHWQVSRLSSGEKQRLALLRLLQNRPRVLLLDEPTANLDATNTRLFEQFVADYRRQQNAVVFWVSHDTEQLRRVADRVFQLQNGQLVEQPCSSH